MQRNQIAMRAQQDLAKLDREITDHRRRTNAQINNQMFHNLMGTEEFVNPITKKVEVGSENPVLAEVSPPRACLDGPTGRL